MYGLPEKQLSFLLRAGCDTLSTPMNLARWNIITDPRCALCQAPQPTTNHILTGCPAALDQDRYTWRHDSVLQVLVHGLQQHLPEIFKLYADLPGYLASSSPPIPSQPIFPPPSAGLTWYWFLMIPFVCSN